MNPKSNTHTHTHNIYIYLIIISTIFFAKEGDPSDSKDFNKTSGIHLPIYLFTHSFTRSFTHSFIHSFIHSFTHSFIHLLIHSFIHSFIHLFFSFLCILLIHDSLRFSLAMHFVHTHSNTQRNPPKG